jgi:hypothetical protein
MLALDLGRLQLHVIGYPIALAILNHFHLLIHLIEMASRLSEALSTLLLEVFTIQQVIASDVRDILPAHCRQQVEDGARRIPNIEQNILWLDA